MTAEERRAERYDPRDTDPLHVDEPTIAELAHAAATGRMRDRETRDEFRSGFVVVWLIAAIVAGAAIGLLWWEYGR